MSLQPEHSVSGDYRPLSTSSVLDYLASHPELALRLGADPARWRAREVGDGNLNLVFIVEGPERKLVIKQALPYVRLVGEGWPLPLSRAHFEHLSLLEQAHWARPYVPTIYHHDPLMALTVMECLEPHLILRKGLIRAVTYPHLARHLGDYLALTLYHSSDLHLSATDKKAKMALFLGNTALCKISEDLIFDEPYFAAPLNRHTSPQLDEISLEFRADAALKLAAQEMKWRFLNAPEALIHGDLHTGSIMVTEEDTRAIDAEFVCYAPIGFDVGMLIANLLMAYYAQPGLGLSPRARVAYAESILEQTQALWNVFASRFAELWRHRALADAGGDAYQPRLYRDAPSLLETAIERRRCEIWRDMLGFCGCEMIRRILGLAHVEDFEAIADAEVRGACERRALRLARELLVHGVGVADIEQLLDAARASP
jgi:5-methylthioribose kinase